MRWSHADMEALMARSTDLRAAMTRAMTAAIVGKVRGPVVLPAIVNVEAFLTFPDFRFDAVILLRTGHQLYRKQE